MQMYGMTGERLGVIGHGPEGLPRELPAWKQDFLSKPSVSVRRGIAWGYRPPCEDTDTLVLTAPSGEFVDIRFPKDATTPQDTSDHPSFWAFSGKATTTFHDAGSQQHAVDMPYTAHCKFSHRIDTRGPGITDEGDMFMLMNGDCLEMGQMVNLATGKEELYKEYWHGADQLPDTDGQDDSKTCIVAHVSSETVEGIIIRLGGRVQGIISQRKQDGSQIVEVERWTRGTSSRARPVEDYAQDVPTGSWSRDVRSSAFLPGGWLCMPERKVGERFEYNGMLWEVTEAHN